MEGMERGNVEGSVLVGDKGAQFEDEVKYVCSWAR
jgi:hypothetical protein